MADGGKSKAGAVCPHLVAVDAAQPFVDVLARHLLDTYGSTEQGLSRVLLLVPTRRAVPAVRQALLQASGGAPMLMPRIEPLGDIDLARLIPERLLASEEGRALLATGIIPERRRTLELSRLVQDERDRLGAATVFSPDQAVKLAQALGDLIDDLAREGIRFDTLAGLVPDEFAEHWQKTIRFLAIAGERWPKRQAVRGGIDAVAHRNAMLHLLAEAWRDQPPDHPVIIAGTTGSMPATAALIRIVAGLAQGEVLLPGLDTECAEEEWEAIGRSVSHPQYGLWKLLSDLGCHPHAIPRLRIDGIPGAPRERMCFLAAAMAPATIASETFTSAEAEAALANFGLVEFADDHAEAEGIMLMLREALEQPGKTAMLVTHDRDLARRVVIGLQRFGIEAEDNGGMKLAETRPATLLFQVLAVAMNGAAPVPLLSLLKHPLCGLGMPIDLRLRATAALEKTLLRGVRTTGSLPVLLELARRRPELGDAAHLLEALVRALSPLDEAIEVRSQGLGCLLECLAAAAEPIAQLPGEPGKNLLWAGQDGRQLAGLLAELSRHADAIGPISPHALPGILESLLARETYHPPRSGHPRLLILSPTEARMQHADRVVMAGLNEECWPSAAPNDPWMNRMMREAAGLAPHERTIGLSAHDFFSLAAAPEVIVTRARKAGETPRIASRWWQRIVTLATAAGLPDLTQSDASRQWLRWAEAAVHAAPVPRAMRPVPSPPGDARPRVYTISDVETLLGDPYRYYARRILGLRELEPLDKTPGQSEFGNAIHKALAIFFASGPVPFEKVSEARLETLIGQQLRHQLRQEALPAFWRQRIGSIVQEVMRGERERRINVAGIETERHLGADLPVAGDCFRLEARADRIDRRIDDRYDILDYKTGKAPGPSDVMTGRKPQLPLEAVLLEQEGRSIGSLLYWSFSRNRSEMGLRLAGGAEDARPLMAEAHAGFVTLARHFAQSGAVYPSLADQAEGIVTSPYSRLDRVKEWG